MPLKLSNLLVLLPIRLLTKSKEQSYGSSQWKCKGKSYKKKHFLFVLETKTDLVRQAQGGGLHQNKNPSCSFHSQNHNFHLTKDSCSSSDFPLCLPSSSLPSFINSLKLFSLLAFQMNFYRYDNRRFPCICFLLLSSRTTNKQNKACLTFTCFYSYLHVLVEVNYFSYFSFP